VIADGIAKLFPNLFGQPSVILKACDSGAAAKDGSLKIGVVLSGGQAPGGHNVISGIFGGGLMYLVFHKTMLKLVEVFLRLFLFVIVSDYLQERTKGSTVYGFKGGPAGIMKCNYVELSTEFIYPYRNQVSPWPFIYTFFLLFHFSNIYLL
jgi:pyrophosphate--fructose-6-phosphate 1-phosphotransferase